MKNIILDEIIVKGNRVDYFFTVNGKVQKYFKKSNHLFMEYNVDANDIPISILTIPFVANIAPLAWITDSSISVSELDESFHDCLSNIKEAYQNMYPEVTFKGQILTSSLVNNSYVPEQEAAQLFSGGLDALATYIRLKDKKPLLITEYAWHHDDIQKSEVWNQDKKHVIRFAMDNGLTNILIDSNYGTFMNAQSIDRDFLKRLGDSWWHGLHHSLAIISAAIPIAYQLKVECIYIASSFFKGYKAKCASDPTVDNEIKYASGKVFHDGYEINRQQKVKIVVDHYSNENKYVDIRVCFLNKGNCCNCEKCLRTIIGIVAEGENPQNFGFNIPDNLSRHINNFLEENIKYFNPSKIMQWKLSINRMRENRDNILYPDLLDWFLDYDFVTERKKSLIKYRVTKFLPIVKRRIRTWLNGKLAQNT
ncbi:peptidase [Oceanobacillus chungangensis]|uniref:Peptidase n=1 Tax=Oceanobacillus chungangensis TaxID=1229152 RepID=A0A3D8PWE1_9BACI|nr:peptidase [Oceanobacillus chungangensis]RDW20413.1 peptidase [Oceanobacillus chungangensis]